MAQNIEYVENGKRKNKWRKEYVNYGIHAILFDSGPTKTLMEATEQ